MKMFVVFCKWSLSGKVKFYGLKYLLVFVLVLYILHFVFEKIIRTVLNSF